MGSAVKSIGSFAGIGPNQNGISVPMANSNSALDQLSNQNSLYGNSSAVNALDNYASGTGSSADALNLLGLTPAQKEEMGNALSTGATTGSKFAAEQLGSDPTYAGLFGGPNGQKGQLQDAEDQLSSLEKTGFSLTPYDYTLAGQASGNIARQYGQSQNNLAAQLAARGLSSAPSGAAGAMFSSSIGNQNEALAQMNSALMQQRFNMTQQQIAQQASIMENLGSQYGGALQNQFGRQMSGAQAQKGSLESNAQAQTSNNSINNTSALNAAGFQQSTTPKNWGDAVSSGLYQGVQSGSGQAFASMFGGGGGTSPAQPGQPAAPGQKQLSGPPAPGTVGALALGG